MLREPNGNWKEERAFRPVLHIRVTVAVGTAVASHLTPLRHRPRNTGLLGVEEAAEVGSGCLARQTQGFRAVLSGAAFGLGSMSALGQKRT